MNHKPILDANLSNYVFGVYPFSLRFQRQHKSKFYLYFEKNLQIISKYDAPSLDSKKNQTVYFKYPEQIQYFRVQSDKNLDYQWSLYIKKIVNAEDIEDFAEGYKISLKNQWNEFRNTKCHHFLSNITFKGMRCNFSYLVIIANSNKQLLELTQKAYTQFKVSLSTNGVTKTNYLGPTIQSKSNQDNIQQIKKKQVAEQNSNNHKNTPKPDKQDKGQCQQAKQQQSILQSPEKIIPNKDNHYLNAFSPLNQPNLKLSNSDIQIGNQIQDQINNSETGRGRQMINILPKQITEDVEQIADKGIRMTCSQLFNQKGQPIIPFYKTKRFIFLIITIISLLSLGWWYLLALNKSPSGKTIKKQKKKAKYQQAITTEKKKKRKLK